MLVHICDFINLPLQRLPLVCYYRVLVAVMLLFMFATSIQLYLRKGQEFGISQSGCIKGKLTKNAKHSIKTPFLGKDTSLCRNCSMYQGMIKHLSAHAPTPQQVFGKNKTCAIVTESKCLLTKKYGKKIDSHDVVLR